LSELTNALDECEFRTAIAALRGLYAIGNEYMTKCEPWALVKNGDTDGAAACLNECFQLIDLYARVSAPFIPTAAEKMQKRAWYRGAGARACRDQDRRRHRLCG
ncbi:MAG: class I tRNA ligase family protein, partial [Clostridia bacterium]|nr:class I tRNA ligase family protein [Clostridia bacterium]